MSDGGKGSSPRPFSVTPEEFEANWDRIFKKKSLKEIEEAILEDEEFKRIEKQKHNSL